MCACVSVCVRVYVCVHACVYICEPMCVCACVRACVYERARACVCVFQGTFVSKNEGTRPFMRDF